MEFNELREGSVYLVRSAQFGVTNKARLISFDTTGLNRPISYWQFTDRGYVPIMTRDHLKVVLEGRARGASTLFALWDFDLKHNDITPVLSEEPQPERI